LVTENKTKIKQLGLNGPDKAHTLTTTVRLKSIKRKLMNRTKWSRQSPYVNHHGTAEVNQNKNKTCNWCVKTTQVATNVDQLTWKRWVIKWNTSRWRDEKSTNAKQIKTIPHAEEMRRAPMLNR